MRDRHSEHQLRIRTRTAFAAVALIAILGAVPHVRAESADEPARILALVSAGVPLRLTLDKTLGQNRSAPAFGNVMVGYALAGGQLRHGFGLGLSWNLGHDGGYTTPVYAADQFALMPSYLAHYTFSEDFFGIGHVGLPILVRGGPSAGLEVGAAIAYRVFAGTGVFAALNLAGFVGVGLNLLTSLELGIVVDYEVLP
jgi:hypothetical protein